MPTNWYDRDYAPRFWVCATLFTTNMALIWLAAVTGVIWPTLVPMPLFALYLIAAVSIDERARTARRRCADAERPRSCHCHELIGGCVDGPSL